MFQCKSPRFPLAKLRVSSCGFPFTPIPISCISNQVKPATAQLVLQHVLDFRTQGPSTGLLLVGGLTQEVASDSKRGLSVGPSHLRRTWFCARRHGCPKRKSHAGPSPRLVPSRDCSFPLDNSPIRDVSGLPFIEGNTHMPYGSGSKASGSEILQFNFASLWLFCLGYEDSSGRKLTLTHCSTKYHWFGWDSIYNNSLTP